MKTATCTAPLPESDKMLATVSGGTESGMWDGGALKWSWVHFGKKDLPHKGAVRREVHDAGVAVAVRHQDVAAVGHCHLWRQSTAASLWLRDSPEQEEDCDAER